MRIVAWLPRGIALFGAIESRMTSMRAHHPAQSHRELRGSGRHLARAAPQNDLDRLLRLGCPAQAAPVATGRVGSAHHSLQEPA